MKKNSRKLLGSISLISVLGVLYSVLVIRSAAEVVVWGQSGTNIPALTDVVAIAGGVDHNLALRMDGTVWAWGGNGNGQINVPPGLRNVVAVAAGDFHSLALRADGTVAVWGGLTKAPAEATNLVAIAAGGNHGLALKADGTVIAWGSDFYGQTRVPTGLSNVVGIACGWHQSLAVRRDGTVAAWGYDSNGQGSVPPNATNVGAISGGSFHNLALRHDGSLISWGYSGYGQTIIPAEATNVVRIAAGEYHNLALRSDGMVIAWGNSNMGQTPAPAGLRNVVAVGAGRRHSLAVSSEGLPLFAGQSVRRTAYIGTSLALDARAMGGALSSYVWNRNGTNIPGATNYLLPLGSATLDKAGIYTAESSSAMGPATGSLMLAVVEHAPILISHPTNQISFRGASVAFEVVVAGTESFHFQWQFNGTPLAGATNRVLMLDSLRLEQSGQYSVLVQNAFGATNSSNATLLVSPVAVWGRNSEGQADVPAGLTNVATVAGGGSHSLILQTDGKVVAWGTNNFGQTNVPANLSNVTAIAAGTDHNLALTATGTVVAWGRNDAGQTNVPVTLTNALAIAAGQSHSLALKRDGTVAAWGGNNAGQTNVPADLTNVVAIAAGGFHGLALKSGGTVVAWGYNAYGQTNVPVGLGNVVAIAAGGNHSLALRGDGTVAAWGRDDAGWTHVPPDLANVVAIAAGLEHSLALRADGTAVAWGSGYYGQTAAPAKLKNVTAIAAGAGHSLALVGDGAPVLTGIASKRTAFTGTTILLNAMVAGAPPLSYQWLFNGTVLVGATNAFLVLTNPLLTQAGTYSVLVSNSFGMATNSETVTLIESALTIVLQPTNQTSYPGAVVRFQTFAEGSGPLHYQWYHDGLRIAGATNSSLLLSPVSLDQAGRYWAVVQNAFVSVTSSNAMLSIPRVLALGLYTTAQPHCASQPTFVPAGLTNQIVDLAGGHHHSLALRADGRVEAWGDMTGYKCRVDYGQTNVPPDLTNAVAIAAGGYHSLAVRSDGTVSAWGRNLSSVPTGLSNVVAVAGGELHSLALRSDGTVVAWGISNLTNVPPGLSNVVAISTRLRHNVALQADGTVVAWGSNTQGQTNVPAGLSNVVAISAGDYYTLALKADGSAVAWPGSSLDSTNIVAIGAGDLYVWALSANGTLTALACQLDCPPPGLTNVVGLGVGPYHVLALLDEGAIVRPMDLAMARLRWLTSGAAPWFAQTNLTVDGGDALQTGAISQGQESRIRTTVFGPGTLSFWWKVSSKNKHDSLRFDMSGVEQARIFGKTDWEQRAVALPPGIQIVEWVYSKQARGRHGEDAGWLDRVRFTPRGTMQPVIAIQPADQSVWRGTMATLAVRAGGVEPLNFQWHFSGASLPGATNATLTLTNVQFSNVGYYGVQVNNAFGTAVSSNALLSVMDGPPQIVGHPRNQVTNPGRTVLLQVSTIGTFPQSYQWRFGNEDIAGATNATLPLEKVTYSQAGAYSVRVSNQYGTVVSSNATLFVVSVLAWGNNDWGQINFLGGLTNAVAIAAGNAHNLALRADGTVVAWGDNRSGQTAVPAWLSNVVAIAAGSSHSLALRNDGTMAAWGDNRFGQLNLPIGLSNVVAISASAEQCLALSRDGRVHAWGANDFGATNVPAGLTNVIAVAMGGDHAVALKSDGTIVAWGYNAANPPPGLSNVVAIASGAFHSLALQANGTVVGWGYGFYGQLNPPDFLTNAVAIAAADDHSLALRADGTIVGWGRNEHGQLNVPAGLSNVVAIASGRSSHTLALFVENSLPAPLGVAPKLLEPVRIGNQFNALLPSVLGKVYAFEFKDSLADSHWLARPLVLGDGTVKTLTDPTAASRQRFYRIREF